MPERSLFTSTINKLAENIYIIFLTYLFSWFLLCSFYYRYRYSSERHKPPIMLIFCGKLLLKLAPKWKPLKDFWRKSPVRPPPALKVRTLCLLFLRVLRSSERHKSLIELICCGKFLLSSKIKTLKGFFMATPCSSSTRAQS